MNSSQAIKSPPRLLKSRMRHTRWFMLLLFPLLIFGNGLISSESFIHEFMDWTGYVLVITCVLGRAYSSAFIGGRKNDEVVREGPFSIVRNPLYVFSFIGILGITMQSGMISVFLAVMLVFVLYYPKVVAREEAFLLDKFGEPYRDYLATVPRWVPNFSLWKEPEIITSRPRFIRETMLDASLFFIALPAFELLETLHESGMITPFITLP